MDRLTELTSRIDEQLTRFGAIDTAQEPWSYPGYCGDTERKPSFPSLYINRSKDAGLMKMQGSGSAMIRYKVSSRNVDESQEDGVPLYGANIEVQSIEPVSTEKETGLESTLFLRQFASDRDRDGAGRFAAGRVPSPADYALADQAKRKKKVALIGGASAAAAGAALGGTASGRRVAGGVVKSALRAGSRLF